MKSANIWKSIKVSSLLAGAVCVVVLFQNCSKVQFGIDEGSKSAAIAGDPVFGTIPTGDDAPTGNTPPPGDDSPQTPGDDGDDGPETSTTVPVSYICSNRKTQSVGTNLLTAASVKVVILNSQKAVVKEVSANVKQDLLNKKSLDMVVIAAGLAKGSYDAYLLPEGASDTKKQNLLFTKTLGNARIAFDVNADKSISITLMPQYAATKGLFVLYDANNPQASEAEGDVCDRRQSPLIVHLDEEGSIFKGFKLSAPLDGVQFDILGERSFPYAHAKKQISWLTDSDTYYFIVKPDASGQVHGINEMFGNNTRGPDGRFAANGYKALAKYDQDKDKLITPADEVYSTLRLWKDENLDGIAQDNELYSLESKGVVAIDLKYDRRFSEVDQYGNGTLMKSVVQTKDGKLHLMFDLWFRYLNITQ
jgi:hypothetical protein